MEHSILYLLSDPSATGQYGMIDRVLLPCFIGRFNVLWRYNKAQKELHGAQIYAGKLCRLVQVHVCSCRVLRSLSSLLLPGDRSHSGHAPCSRPLFDNLP